MQGEISRGYGGGRSDPAEGDGGDPDGGFEGLGFVLGLVVEDAGGGAAGGVGEGFEDRVHGCIICEFLVT